MEEKWTYVPEENQQIFSDYFDKNIYLLKFSALWLYDEHKSSSKKYFQLIYNIIWAVYLHFIYFPTEIMYLFYVYNDLNGFVRTFRDMGNHIALIYKAINWFRMRKDIIELLNTLATFKITYEDYGSDFKPKLILLRHKKEAMKWKNMFWSFVNGICICMFLSGMFLFLFDSENQYAIDEHGKKVYAQKLPVEVVSPFGTGTKIQFLVTFVYVVMALTFYAWMIVGVDSLFTTIISCVSAHTEILSGAFRTIRPRCLKRLGMPEDFKCLHDPPELVNVMQAEMRRCIIHLQTIYKVSQKLEYIYNFQTAFQVFFSLLEICFCLYLLSLELNESTGNEIAYLISTGFQLLMYCWFGNRVTEASFSIRYAIYESQWLSCNEAYKKEIILTQKRMQRPIYVTIGKITPLTFSTFLTIARGAYSFFTFLKQRTNLEK